MSYICNPIRGCRRAGIGAVRRSDRSTASRRAPRGPGCGASINAVAVRRLRHLLDCSMLALSASLALFRPQRWHGWWWTSLRQPAPTSRPRDRRVAPSSAVRSISGQVVPAITSRRSRPQRWPLSRRLSGVHPSWSRTRFAAFGGTRSARVQDRVSGLSRFRHTCRFLLEEPAFDEQPSSFPTTSEVNFACSGPVGGHQDLPGSGHEGPPDGGHQPPSAISAGDGRCGRTGTWRTRLKAASGAFPDAWYRPPAGEPRRSGGTALTGCHLGRP